ncbi:hypothetical protein EMPS_01342 [Entomortierella parvispora]|uniref:General transcription factor TFIIB n=1 Tax=Entomortierella parvispora TaxID=205924 RepID=A0A9P3LSG2_9FUNG|nr:hypothetical protein EMPS_01342 [Entomortierella parvispora]
MPSSKGSTTEISLHATNLKDNAIHIPANESIMKPRTACESCGGNNVEVHHGELVCTGCGTILERSVLVNTDLGLTQVNVVGRDRNANRRQLAQVAYGGAGKKLEVARAARFQRTMMVESLLGTVAFSIGLGENDVKRALYLWGHLPVPTSGGKERRVTRRALACLYLCSKESKKGVTLVEIAARLSIDLFKLGAEYKRIKAELANKRIIDYSHPCFFTEDDIWILLDRIMIIGSAASIQRGDSDRLTPQLKEALGINAEDRADRLRKIWSSSQKCLKIAMDAGLATGRRSQAVVAACLMMTIQIQLQLTECPKCLVEFVCQLFSIPEHTAAARYKELQSCMLSWARRLPFIPHSKKITGSRLVYYLEDVLRHFGHLDELNKNLWGLLDNPICDDSDQEDGDQDESDDGQHRADDQAPVSSSSLSSEGLNSNGSCVTQSSESSIVPIDNDSSHNNSSRCTSIDESSFEPVYPPSFVANQKRRHNQASLIGIAKEQMPNDKVRYYDQKRLDWIKCLLKQGARSEQDIISASDTSLARWCAEYELEASGITRSKPSPQELDSCDLSERDLPEEELGLYLRSEQERKTLWRVVAPDYLESEKRAEENKEKKTAAQERRIQRKRLTQSQSAEGQHSVKRARSSKLCWDAISDTEDAGIKDGAHQPSTTGTSLDNTVGHLDAGSCKDPFEQRLDYIVERDYGCGYGNEDDYEEEGEEEADYY